MNDAVQKLKGQLVVSSQASIGEPLCAPEHICAMALSALNGGATALRLEGVDNVRYVRKQVSVPIVGLTKDESVPEEKRLSSVYITPTYEDCAALAESGADIVALDCTQRPRKGGDTVGDIIKRFHANYAKPIWADCSTFEEGLAAAEAGADIVSTTLSGYTAETEKRDFSGPDFKMLSQLIKMLKVPVILEGKVWTPEEVAKGFELGAHAVVVGSAITRPQLITRRFVDAIPKLN